MRAAIGDQKTDLGGQLRLGSIRDVTSRCPRSGSSRSPHQGRQQRRAPLGPRGGPGRLRIGDGQRSQQIKPVGVAARRLPHGRDGRRIALIPTRGELDQGEVLTHHTDDKSRVRLVETQPGHDTSGDAGPLVTVVVGAGNLADVVQ